MMMMMMTCVRPTFTWPCFSRGHRITLATSRGPHPVQIMCFQLNCQRQSSVIYISVVLQPLSALSARCKRPTWQPAMRGATDLPLHVPAIN